MYAVQGVYTGGDTVTVPHGAIQPISTPCEVWVSIIPNLQTSGERDKKIIAANAERFNAEVAETMLFQAAL
jgi:hypothetical protein